jgi:hypothetical protein
MCGSPAPTPSKAPISLPAMRANCRKDTEPSVPDKADIKAMGSRGVAVTGGAKCTVSAAGSGKVRCS